MVISKVAMSDFLIYEVSRIRSEHGKFQLLPLTNIFPERCLKQFLPILKFKVNMRNAGIEFIPFYDKNTSVYQVKIFFYKGVPY